MTEKDYQLYGTKILNLKTQEIGLLICIWKNTFADGEVDYATCVGKIFIKLSRILSAVRLETL